MKIGIASHAHRKLKGLKRYVSSPKMTSDDLSLLASKIPAAGAVVGCYFNDLTNLRDRIVITDNGLVTTVDETFRFVRYRNMSHVVRGESKDVESDEILVMMRSAAIETIVIRGKDSEMGFHDKFAVMMFLESAISVHAAARPPDSD